MNTVLLADILSGYSERRIDVPSPLGYRSCNPSIAWVIGNDGRRRLECVVRTVNYTIQPDGSYAMPGGVIRTQNVLCDVDPKTLALSHPRMILVPTQDGIDTTSTVRGYEDMRLFSGDGKRYASATVRDRAESAMACQIAVVEIADNGLATLVHVFPYAGRAEKNWMPIADLDDGPNLAWLYALSPLEVRYYYPITLRGWDPTGIFKPSSPQTIHIPSARGGSQVLRLADGRRLCVVHTVEHAPGGRVYYHRFVLLDETLRVTYVSPAWALGKHRIEFCAGAAVVDGELLLSFGVHDAEAWLVGVDLAGVLALAAGAKADKDDPVMRAVRAMNNPTADIPGNVDSKRGTDPDPLRATTGFPGKLVSHENLATMDMSKVEAFVRGFPLSERQELAKILHEQIDQICKTGTTFKLCACLGCRVCYRQNNGSGLLGPHPCARTAEEEPDTLCFFCRKELPATNLPPPFLVSTTLAHNAESIIGDALRSVVDKVDLCIVIDTGITDTSIGIARDICGDKLRVFAYPWANDFSAARNFALQCAETVGATWAVTVDTDERIALGEGIRALPDLSHLIAKSKGGEYEKERIIRLTSRGYTRTGRWHGRTHECYLGSGFAVLPAAVATFAELSKTGDQHHAKLLRDKPLLETHIREEPHDGRWPYYLAQTLEGLGGEENKKEAIRLYRLTGTLHSGDNAAWSLYKAATLACQAKDYAQALECCALGLVQHPGYSELAWLAGHICGETGRHEHACAWARMSAAGGALGNRISRTGFFDRFGMFEGPFHVLQQLAPTDEAKAEGKRFFEEAKALRERGTL